MSGYAPVCPICAHHAPPPPDSEERDAASVEHSRPSSRQGDREKAGTTHQLEQGAANGASSENIASRGAPLGASVRDINYRAT